MTTSLKQLNLSQNYLKRDGRLSDKLSALTNLEILNLKNCGLKELPDGYVIDMMCYYCHCINYSNNWLAVLSFLWNTNGQVFEKKCLISL